MTICIVTDNFPPDLGGIATYYGNLSAIMTDSGHNVIILKADYEAEDDESDELVQVGLRTIVTLKKSYKKYFNYYKEYFRPGGLNAPLWISAGLSIRDWL